MKNNYGTSGTRLGRGGLSLALFVAVLLPLATLAGTENSGIVKNTVRKDTLRATGSAALERVAYTHSEDTTRVGSLDAVKESLAYGFDSSCPTITLSPGMLSNANVGEPYSVTITATGGTSPYSYSVTSGSLPPGLSLSTDGVLSGTATTPGSYNFTVTATDANNCTGSLNYYLTVPEVGTKEGGGLYFAWTWPASAAYDIQQLDMDLGILNDPETTDILFFSNEFWIGTSILKTNCYYGLQTNLDGRGKGLIFSAFGTTDLSNVRTSGTSWAVAGTNEGPFISLRRLFNWTTHNYILRLVSETTEDDTIGRWFNYYIIDTETGEQTYIGALRFPMDSSGQYPFIMPSPGFGSWIEHAHLVSSPSDVPLWKVAIGRPVANGGDFSAESANWWFGPPSDYWQNSDIWAEGQTIHAQLGDDTQRIHGDTGSLIYCTLICWANVPTTATVGTAASFTATATPSSCTGTPTWDWDFGDGSAHDTAQNPTHAYAAEGTYNWTMTASVDSQTCTKTGSISVNTAPPPTVTDIKKAQAPGNPSSFKIKIYGTNFDPNCQVYVGSDTSAWTNVKWKDSGKIVLKKGKTLKNKFPKGVCTAIHIVNPDGGEVYSGYQRGKGGGVCTP